MKTTFVDLFSGCGGFSLGLNWAGLEELAAIDFDHAAMSVFRANFPESTCALEKDLQKFKPEDLEELINKKSVDVIIGGPPCQGFSTVRQRDGSNSGERIIDDQRRELYQELLKYVDYYKPKFFIMENVPGIRSAAGGHFFNKVQFEARKLGYRVHSEVIKAWEYGVPQKRKRQLIIGTQLDLPLFSIEMYMPATHSIDFISGKEKIVTLWEAIGDLPPIESGEGDETQNYDLDFRSKQIKKYTDRYIIKVLGVDRSPVLTSHQARKHSERDLRDFASLREGENGAHAIKRGVKMEFPYDRENFKDRYTKQSRNGLCSTIVAHLSKDGLMFIHPTQNRSLTPREAARIQSFPDYFHFPVSRTDQYKLIGNAVPPLIGLVLGKAIKKWLDDVSRKTIVHPNREGFEILAIQSLTNLKELMDAGKLKVISDDNFLSGWKGISTLYKNLHPRSAFENGTLISPNPIVENPMLERIDSRLITPIYERSGWPVYLVPVAKEARRRYLQNKLTIDEYLWNF